MTSHRLNPLRSLVLLLAAACLPLARVKVLASELLRFAKVAR